MMRFPGRYSLTSNHRSKTEHFWIAVFLGSSVILANLAYTKSGSISSVLFAVLAGMLFSASARLASATQVRIESQQKSEEKGTRRESPPIVVGGGKKLYEEHNKVIQLFEEEGEHPDFDMDDCSNCSYQCGVECEEHELFLYCGTCYYLNLPDEQGCDDCDRESYSNWRHSENQA